MKKEFVEELVRNEMLQAVDPENYSVAESLLGLAQQQVDSENGKSINAAVYALIVVCRDAFDGHDERRKVFIQKYLEDANVKKCLADCKDGIVYNGQTLLGIPTICKSAELVKFLVGDLKFDINQPNERGNTPLHNAAGSGIESVAMLLLNGANPTICNRYGETPALQLGGHPVIEQFLQDWTPVYANIIPLLIAKIKEKSSKETPVKLLPTDLLRLVKDMLVGKVGTSPLSPVSAAIKNTAQNGIGG